MLAAGLVTCSQPSPSDTVLDCTGLVDEMDEAVEVTLSIL